MPKQLVETTGRFELVDFSAPNPVIRADRPTVIEQSTFTSGRAALGQIRFLANLTDEATDEEFEKYVVESPDDIDFAIEAFKSAFAPEAGTSKRKPKSEETENVTEEPSTPKRARQGKVETVLLSTPTE